MQETFGAVEDTSVEEIDLGKLVERSETLVHIRFMMNWSFVIRVVELLKIVGQLVQSGGFLDVVSLEKLRGHSAVLTDLAEAVLAADAHTCDGVREVGDDRWRRARAGRRGTGRECRLGDIQHGVIPNSRSQRRTFEIRRRLVLGAGSLGSLEVGTAEIDEPHLIGRGTGFASASAKDRALALVSLGVAEIGAATGVAVGTEPELSPNGFALVFSLASDDHEVDGRPGTELDGRPGTELVRGKLDPAGRPPR